MEPEPLATDRAEPLARARGAEAAAAIHPGLTGHVHTETPHGPGPAGSRARGQPRQALGLHRSRLSAVRRTVSVGVTAETNTVTRGRRALTFSKMTNAFPV